MSKLKTNLSKNASKQHKGTAPDDAPTSWSHTLRETVESIVIAFILAFLFRTFEAEAFVIPTGSMAPVLQGRHKDIFCPQCGYEYRTGASGEVDKDTNALLPHHLLSTATCPNCRFTANVGPSHGHPSYSGDRIIVSKFAYDISNPERWDVIVFKYPEDAKQNYIKRLVGMPNERLKIVKGDIYTAPPGSNDFTIERKGKHPTKLRAMLQSVYDNDHISDELVKAGFPARWQSWNTAGEAKSWTASEDGRSFEIDGKNSGWLRYQHLVPDDWNAIEGNKVFFDTTATNTKPAVVPQPEPSLIYDYYAYNVGEFNGGNPPADRPHWVGDLALTCNVEVKTAQGNVVFELIKGRRQFQCSVNLASGEATLSIPGLDNFAPVGQTAMKAPGNYAITFANVDEQLLLWVDDKLVTFNGDTTFQVKYDRPADDEKNVPMPVPGKNEATDLSPVGIATEGGAAVKISGLKIERDIYYVSPRGVNTLDAEHAVREIDKDQYFMLGDNSPQSQDSRYWGLVDRSLLIGKALFIYWPHSWDEIEIGSVKIPFPFFPNFGDMGFVK